MGHKCRKAQDGISALTVASSILGKYCRVRSSGNCLHSLVEWKWEGEKSVFLLQSECLTGAALPRALLKQVLKWPCSVVAADDEYHWTAKHTLFFLICYKNIWRNFSSNTDFQKQFCNFIYSWFLWTFNILMTFLPAGRKVITAVE